MKVLFVIVIFGVLHYSNATGGKCSCGVFLRDGSTNHPQADTSIFSTEDKDVDSCDDAGKTACNTLCHNTIDKLTDGGKLDHKNKEGKTMAEIACTKLHRDVSNGEVGSFIKVCDGEWEYTHGTTPKHLCCTGNHPVAC